MKRNSGELASPEERCHFDIRANLRRRLRAQTLPCELLDYGIQVLIIVYRVCLMETSAWAGLTPAVLGCEELQRAPLLERLLAKLFRG